MAADRLRAVWTDDGLATGRWHQQADRAQLRACLRGEAGALLRIHRYPPTVTHGRHERPEDSARDAFCEAHGIAVLARLTGGGAVYRDPGQIGWTLVWRAPATDTLADILARLSAAVAGAGQASGVALTVAGANDFEWQGRRVGCGFVLRRADRWCVYQGLLIERLDLTSLLKALRIPLEKLTPAGLVSAAQRFGELPATVLQERLVECLVGSLGTAIGVSFVRDRGGWPGAVADRPLPAAVVTRRPRPGETLKAVARLKGGVMRAEIGTGEHGRAGWVRLSGSVQISPPGILAGLGRRLRGCEMAAVGVRARAFLVERGLEGPGIDAEALAGVLDAAAARVAERDGFGLTSAQANTLMRGGPKGAANSLDLVAQAQALLVPYCAKPLWCRQRNEEDCDECGLCDVGEAYRLGREYGLRVRTIINFEHLERTLAELSGHGVRAYLGLCCEDFFLKRHHAFERAGIPALLLDITGANCYRLNREDDAYAGRFDAQAEIRLDVLSSLLARRKMATSGGQ